MTARDRIAARLPEPARRAAQRARAVAAGKSGGGAGGGGASQGALWNPAGRGVPPDPVPDNPVSRRLAERLDDTDLAELEARLDSEHARIWREATERDRPTLALAYGVHYRVPAIMEKTGLSPADPPDEVHAMGRGPLAAGGSYYYADLVADALAESGMPLHKGLRGLDFGCSSGRAVRVLAAAHPEVDWHGCDPIEDSVEWAKQHLAGIHFFCSGKRPPLPFDDGALDFAFAISIWSHFAEEAALAWLEEMQRVIAPGGRLVITTHGLQSISHYNDNGLRDVQQLAHIARAMYEQGFWYAPEFGEQGDHGLVDSEWGTAFFTAEWLLRHVLPAWRALSFAPGRAEDNQDLYVLERTA